MEDWCFPGYCPRPSMSSSSLVEDGKILLVSGLDLVNNKEDLCLDLLSEWITGMAGRINAQREEAVIARVIITGERKYRNAYISLLACVIHKHYTQIIT